jgi:hypothetical protein
VTRRRGIWIIARTTTNEMRCAETALPPAQSKPVPRPSTVDERGRPTRPDPPKALSPALRAESARSDVRVVLVEPTGYGQRFVEAHLQATHSYPHDDPHGDFKRRYTETTRADRDARVVVGADTVARAVLRAVEAKNPSPAISSGRPGRPRCWLDSC